MRRSCELLKGFAFSTADMMSHHVRAHVVEPKSSDLNLKVKQISMPRISLAIPSEDAITCLLFLCKVNP